MFSTQRNLDLLAHCSNWHAVVTFRITPPLFKQLHTFHAVQYTNVIPIVFVLKSETANKKINAYARVLTELNKLHRNLNPTSIIMTDFEHAAVHQNGERRRSFFHLSQCTWRRLQHR